MEYRSDILKDLRVEINKEKNEGPLIMGVTLFVMILLTILFLVPTAKKVNNLKTEIQEIESLKEKYNKILVSYKKAAAYNEQLNPYKKKIFSRVPEEPNSIEAFDKLDFIAKINNLKLNKLTTKQTLENTESFNMAFTGEFSNIEEFFKKIEISDRFFSISSLTIRQNGNNKKQNSDNKNKELFFNLVVNSWFLDEQ